MFLLILNSGDPIEEKRKHAIPFATTLLCARKLIEAKESIPDIRHDRNRYGRSSAGSVTLAVQLFARLASTVFRKT
jgi:hypothetical protein